MASIPPTTAPTPTDAYVEPLATWQVTLDGQDITSRFNPRLISLKLSLYRHEKADELDIELSDDDGKLNIPNFNATLSVSLGWTRGTGVIVGLVPMGTFVVDDVTWEGPPDILKIKAHSADMKDSFRTRKTRTWTAQTVGAITTQIASDQGLTPRIHPDLAEAMVDADEQANQSDMEYLRDLGRRHDAVATVKGGALIFAPVDAMTTATGQTLPKLTLTRQSGDKYSFNRNARVSNFKGAEANHYDQNGGLRVLHQVGTAPHKRLKRVYGTAATAARAARSEHKRIKRAEARLDITLAYGNTRIAPGMTATAQGFKPVIDATTWLIAHVEHEMGPSGFSTHLEMEVGGQSESAD